MTKSKKKRVITFQTVEDECIWMKTGVVNFRLCDNAYDCYNCPFDKGMRRTMKYKNHTEPKWVNNLKTRYQGSERPCRHYLTGRINTPKICPMNYECFHCIFDQTMDELDFEQPQNTFSYNLESGYLMAEGYYYHMGHNWVRFDHGGRIRVGFDSFLTELFGILEFIVLPPLGTNLIKDQAGLAFGRGNHKAISLSPVTGTVIAVNHKAWENPEIIYKDPYYEGWLYIIEPDMPKKNLKGLYYGDESIEWMKQENQSLLDLIGPKYKKVLPIKNVLSNFPELEWHLLVKKFLRTKSLC